MNWEIRQGAALDLLKAMPDGCVQTCITSPPYFGLRAYGTNPQIWGGDPDCSHTLTDDPERRPMTGGTGEKSAKQVTNAGSQFGNAWVQHPGDPKGWGGASGKIKRPESINLANADTANGSNSGGAYNRGSPRGSSCTLCGAWRGELGSEPTPAMFVDHLVDVFREVRRTLRDDGTLWLNLGDSYSGSGKGPTGFNGLGDQQQRQGFVNQISTGLPAKNLQMVPWRLALALQDDGWIVRSVIVWAKRAPMPESVVDRPTSAWEPIFLLSKNPRYYYDAAAVAEPMQGTPHAPGNQTAEHWQEIRGASVSKGMSGHLAEPDRTWGSPAGRNQRNVWEIPGDDLSDFWKLSPEPFKGSHFAVMPSEIARRAILAGSKPGDLILDPFAGSGTVPLVANRLGRRGLGLELNPDYASMARDRIQNDAPLCHAIAAAPPPAQPSLFGGQP